MTAAVLEARGVTVRFGGLVAVNNVDFVVPGNAIVGLVGPNGAGKTTLFETISGFITPNAGDIVLGGEPVTRLSPQARARRGISRTFQRMELFPELTVRQHVLLSRRVTHRPSRLREFVLGSYEAPAEREAVDGLLSSLGLTDVADRYAATLPLGVGRLVEVARSLAADPRVLLLDEPSSGLDETETDRLAEVLLDARKTRELALVLVEHNLSLVLGLCDEVQVLDFGETIARGTPAEVRDDPRVQAAYIGDVEVGA
ncbi:ABC transporter ATP-binding protein [Dactylosporangium sucinum]|uniref:ABC transporter ATP-binding protein n=1 Tax=Dactylosporangium sucinum TaxID=1424081 RepID=A0A917X4A3_9ACTN|nr:ABC transporter ATP-binding protein [Dactylosporangium sucinum]GGM64592.1 ABC transporter ATP-binding protein [Dactylosporangium sucinum]